VRYGTGTWRSGAGLSEPCAMAQQRLRNGAGAMIQPKTFPDRCAMAQAIGAMAQPREWY
jgi:hypothetical protein